MQALAKAEPVALQHGAMGGYALAPARPATTISTLEVVATSDGSPVVTNCATVHGTCEMVHHCIVKEPLRRVNKHIKSVLGASGLRVGRSNREYPLG